MKRIFSIFGLALLMVLVTSVLTAAAPIPNVAFNLVQGLPSTMNIGDTYTVVVDVTSDTPYNTVIALPSFQYPGKGVVAVQGGNHAGSGTSATVEVAFTAKSNTLRMTNNQAVVHVVVGARFQGGYVASQDFIFYVTVP